MTIFRREPVRVRVPATSANLGPGFDAAGLALGRYDDVVVGVTEHGLSVEVTGEGADTLPRDGRHLVVRALRETFDRLGGRPDGLDLVCANAIPQARGLGSSAAAIVAGVLAARALVDDGEALLDDDAVLAAAAALEGHPDNVAACLLGGLSIAWIEAGTARAVRLEPARELAPVVFVPRHTADTATVRGLLPRRLSHADAAAGAGRAALLSVALTTRPDLLLAATEDWLHQRYRAPAMPESFGLLERLRADGVPAVISGAGPSVLALGISGAAAALSRYAGLDWAVLEVPLDRHGAQVLPLAS